MEWTEKLTQHDGEEAAQVTRSNRSAFKRPSPVLRARPRARVLLLVGILILESVALLVLRAGRGGGGSTDRSGVLAWGSQSEAAFDSGGGADETIVTVAGVPRDASTGEPASP